MEKARIKWNIKDSGAPANFEQLFREIIGRRTGPLLSPLYQSSVQICHILGVDQDAQLRASEQRISLEVFLNEMQ